MLNPGILDIVVLNRLVNNIGRIAVGTDRGILRGIDRCRRPVPAWFSDRFLRSFPCSSVNRAKLSVSSINNTFYHRKFWLAITILYFGTGLKCPTDGFCHCAEAETVPRLQVSAPRSIGRENSDPAGSVQSSRCLRFSSDLLEVGWINCDRIKKSNSIVFLEGENR